MLMLRFLSFACMVTLGRAGASEKPVLMPVFLNDKAIKLDRPKFLIGLLAGCVDIYFNVQVFFLMSVCPVKSLRNYKRLHVKTSTVTFFDQGPILIVHVNILIAQ